MTLYEQWTKKAYDQNGVALSLHWEEYTPFEEAIYTHILLNKITNIKTTITKFATTHNIPTTYVVGFIDGINECLTTTINVQNLTEESELNLNFTFETLFKKMVEYKADNLYSLDAWNNIFDQATRKKLYEEQKNSTTFVRDGLKIGRNDPCACGSNKKYKFCCANS